MTKIIWTQPNEFKIATPISLSQFNIEKIYSKFFIVADSSCASYVLLFIDYTLVIFRLYETKLIFENKKILDMFSYDEEIATVKQNQTCGNNFLISTNKGNVFIILFDLSDFFPEVIFSFSFRQNYIYDNEIFYYDGNFLIVSFDNNLFLCELAKYGHANKQKSLSASFTVIKTCLLKIEYIDEKILWAVMKNNAADTNYVVIFTNKSIQVINLAMDGTVELLFKKDPQMFRHQFLGFVFNDYVYYVKDENELGVSHVYDKENKTSIKLTSKNLLNKLKFYKVIHVDENIIIISNETESELYFLNHKYKILHREAILFERKCFICRMGICYAIGINLLNLVVKFKYGYSSEVQSVNNPINRYENNINRNNHSFSLAFDLSEFENEFVSDDQKDSQIKQKVAKKKNKIKNFLKSIYQLRYHHRWDTYELFRTKKIKIHHTISKILTMHPIFQNFRFSERIFNQVKLCFIALFGSHLLKLNTDVIVLLYIGNKFIDKCEFLMELSQKNQDYDTMVQVRACYHRIKQLFS